MGYWIVDGRKLTNEEYEELQRQKKLEKQRVREEEQRLTKHLGAAYAALKEHLLANQGTDRRLTDEQTLERQIYSNLWHNLERANKAPRCSAIKEDGTRCGSPKMKNHIYCYAHCQMMEMRAKTFYLPPVEDANAIQMAIMRVQQALIDDEISEKKAGLLLYSLQLAATNVERTTFGEAADEDMVTETVFETDGMEAHTESQELRRKLDEMRGKVLPAASDGKDVRQMDAGEQQTPRHGGTGEADERGLEAEALPAEALPSGENDDTGGSEVGKILPQSAHGGEAQLYANLAKISEVCCTPKLRQR
jgi:hypothetical protein